MDLPESIASHFVCVVLNLTYTMLLPCLLRKAPYEDYSASESIACLRESPFFPSINTVMSKTNKLYKRTVKKKKKSQYIYFFLIFLKHRKLH